MREPISLKEILAVVVKRGKGIVCTVVALSLLAGGYQLSRQLQQSKLPEYTPERLEAVYQEQKKAYDEQLAELTAALEQAKTAVQRHQQYRQTSVRMKLDPYNTPRSTIVLSIVGVDSQMAPEGNEGYSDRENYMIERIQDHYKLYWSVAELEKELKGHDYTSLEERYLRELVDLSASDGGTLKITTIAETEEAAQRLATAIYNLVVSKQAQIAESTYPHQLKLLNESTNTTVFQSVQDAQNSAKEQEATWQAEVESIEYRIATLAAPAKGVGYTTGSMVKSAVKWAILGAAVGAILSCGWVLVMYVFRCRVESSRQLEKMLGIPFMGSVAPRGDLWKRLAEKVLDERSWKDPAEASAYITENLKTAVDSGESVAIVTTLNAKGTEAALEALEQAAQPLCAKVYCLKNAEKNPETASAIKACQYVLLAERTGVSEVSEMETVMDMAKRAGSTVIGFVTI